MSWKSVGRHFGEYWFIYLLLLIIPGGCGLILHDHDKHVRACAPGRFVASFSAIVNDKDNTYYVCYDGKDLKIKQAE
jgi:hypothetical protein